MTSIEGRSKVGALASGDGLARELESAILAGRITPGSRLPSERELAVQFSVSRAVTRDALRSLRERGLAVAQVGRGTFVRELNLDEGAQSVENFARAGHVTAAELIAARTMLEAEAAALAAVVHNERDERRMTQTLAAFSSAEDLEVRAALDVRFHESIAVASHNAVLRLMFGSIRTLVHGMVLRSLTDRQVTDAGSPQHEYILEAILDRDPQAARAAVAEHMAVAGRFYGADLQLPLAKVLRDTTSVEPEVSRLLNEAASSIAADDPRDIGDPR